MPDTPTNGAGTHDKGSRSSNQPTTPAASPNRLAILPPPLLRRRRPADTTPKQPAQRCLFPDDNSDTDSNPSTAPTLGNPSSNPSTGDTTPTDPVQHGGGAEATLLRVRHRLNDSTAARQEPKPARQAPAAGTCVAPASPAPLTAWEQAKLTARAFKRRGQNPCGNEEHQPWKKPHLGW